VAGLLGRLYQGLELRGEQVTANRAQAEEIFGSLNGTPRPQWVQTDSAKMEKVLGKDFSADFVFSCPPYADLEVYSDDPADLSNMGYDAFLRIYREIIRLTVARLRQDSFAVWVVGEVRGKRGSYYGFVPDTIKAFEDAGANFYNEAILVNAVGSAAIRAPRQFEAGRKLCKVHQNVLVFIKGDSKKATERVGAVEFGDIQAAVAATEVDAALEAITDASDL
jgi:hypothetical protein